MIGGDNGVGSRPDYRIGPADRINVSVIVHDDRNPSIPGTARHSGSEAIPAVNLIVLDHEIQPAKRPHSGRESIAAGSLSTMADQQPVEMILLRQLASYLTLPIWMMDQEGNLLYYNEPAERLLGVQFDDAGPIKAEELTEMFKTTTLDGEPLEAEGMPVVAALSQRHPVHGAIRFCGLDGMWRDVEISAMPVEGQGARFLGVFATFWEIPN